MSKRQHAQELLATCRKEWGRLGRGGIRPSADNRACLLHFGGVETVNGSEEPDPSLTVKEAVAAAREALKERIVFNGQVVAESEDGGRRRHREVLTSLSFDGRMLAIGRRVRAGDDFYYEIAVNGAPPYVCAPQFFVYQLAWLDNDRLAWYGWFQGPDGGIDDKRRGIAYFVNGRDVTGRLMFEAVLGDRMSSEHLVQENGVRYVLQEDGTRSHERPACCDSFMCMCDYETRRAQPKPECPEEISAFGVRVKFNGRIGPGFDALESRSGLRTYAFNADRSRVGYVGIRYAPFVRLIGLMLRPFAPFLGWLTSGEKNPLAWLAALLFNPYFGPGYAAIESSKRYHPVSGTKAWRRGYDFADDQFFTPNDELIVTACGDKKAMVVIDEDEGPGFDEIVNVRWLAAENCVCYLGRDGDQIYRVTAKREDPDQGPAMASHIVKPSR